MVVASTSDLAVTMARVEVVRYITVGSMVLLTYDWFISLAEEVQLVWGTPLSISNILYFLSRYTPFIDTTLNVIFYVKPGISVDECLPNYTISSWSTYFGMGASESILLWRTYIIWEKPRAMLYGFCILWILWVVGNIYPVVLFSRSLKFTAQPLPNIPGCNLVASDPLVFISFVSFLAMEILIVILTVIKGIKHVQVRHSPLVVTLYRDGVLFFICLAMLSLGNVIQLLTAPVEFTDLLNTMTRVLHSLLCCRVLLNIRGVTHNDDLVTSSRTRLSSGISFLCCKSSSLGSREDRYTETTAGIQLSTLPNFGDTTYNRTIDF